MSQPVAVVWDDAFTRYDFGAGHPMNPVRLDLTARLCRGFDLFDSVDVLDADVPDDELLLRVHDEEYVAAVKAASADPDHADPRFGLGTEDDPAFAGIHEAAARICEGSRAVAERVWTGEARRGVNFTGGMHHAMRERAAGFCVYNDAAVAIDWLLDHGATRIAYVDVDAHHGDGVERAFWNDPRVLTVSLHETGMVLFPGTGFPGDLGGPDALGTAVNVALPPGTNDAAWLRAFHAVAPPIVRAFAPQILITQHGADTHATDPLAHMSISVDAQRLVMQSLADLADEVCEGRWISLGGGGYEVVGVVPRSWTHLVAIAAGRPIDPDTPVPQAWLDDVTTRLGVEAPPRMGDGTSEAGRIWWRPWDGGFDPDHSLDRAVMAAREGAFPHHGLDMWFD